MKKLPSFDTLNSRFAQVQKEVRERLDKKPTASPLTFNDLVYLSRAAKATLKTLLVVQRMNKHPEQWSRVELARGTPSWTRVKAQKKEADRVKALRLAIKHAEKTLENA